MKNLEELTLPYIRVMLAEGFVCDEMFDLLSRALDVKERKQFGRVLLDFIPSDPEPDDFENDKNEKNGDRAVRKLPRPTGGYFSRRDGNDTADQVRNWVRGGSGRSLFRDDVLEQVLNTRQCCDRLVECLDGISGRNVLGTELPGVERLSRVFPLRAPEKKVLTLLYLNTRSRDLNKTIDEWQETCFLGPLPVMSRLCGEPMETLQDLLFSERSSLKPWLEDNPRHYNSTRFQSLPNLIGPIQDLMDGFSPEHLVSRNLIAGPESYPLETFPLDPKDKTLLGQFLTRSEPARILFRGNPGTGKTTLADAVIRAAGKTPLWFRSNPEENNAELLNLLSLTAQMNQSGNIVLVIDEADDILNVRNSASFFADDSKFVELRKGDLNRFIDTCPVPTLWITNKSSKIDTSTFRRFDYQLHFDELKREQRLHFWKVIREKRMGTELLSDEAIEDLADRWNISPACADAALKAALEWNGTPAEKMEILERTIENQLEVQPQFKVMPRREKDHYCLESLNTSLPAVELDAAVDRYLKVRKGAMAMLFYGLPGTGKSELARQISLTRDIPLVRKQASDLLSMWVGGTEQNIRAAFSEARRKKGLLLIDEADTFLASREGAHRSWEISQVNEMLASLESHEGIVVFTTNRKDSLDPAALRRFAFKVEFLNPTADQRVLLAEAWFPGRPEVSAAARTLDSLNAGDFAAAAGQLKWLGEDPSDEGIIDALRGEVSARKKESRPVGF